VKKTKKVKGVFFRGKGKKEGEKDLPKGKGKIKDSANTNIRSGAATRKTTKRRGK